MSNNHHSIYKSIPIVLICWFMTTSHTRAQDNAEKYVEGFDSLGYRNGWFIDYWDENFKRVKKSDKASYASRAYYSNGVRVTLYGIRRADTYYKLIGDSLIELKSNTGVQKPIMLDGHYLGFNKKGKLSCSQQFSDGRPVGTFKYMDKKCDHVETLQVFSSMNASDTLAYEMWDLQVGTGSYYYHYLYKKVNGAWSYCSGVDTSNKQAYMVVLFSDNRPNNMLASSQLIVNDSLLIKFDRNQYCTFYLDSPKLKIKERLSGKEVLLNIESKQTILSASWIVGNDLSFDELDYELWPKVRQVRKLKQHEEKMDFTKPILIPKEKRKKWS